MSLFRTLSLVAAMAVVATATQLPQQNDKLHPYDGNAAPFSSASLHPYDGQAAPFDTADLRPYDGNPSPLV